MKLTEKHHQAIVLLVTGSSSKEAAETIGVAPETLSRWRQDVYFRAELNGILLETKESVRDRLRFLCGKSLDTIESVMDAPDVPAKDKLTAAFKVLELCKTNGGGGTIESSNPEVLLKKDRNRAYIDSL